MTYGLAQALVDEEFKLLMSESTSIVMTPVAALPTSMMAEKTVEKTVPNIPYIPSMLKSLSFSYYDSLMFLESSPMLPPVPEYCSSPNFSLL